ncbi:hypothetical protein EST38_g1793 [Candolleomyces aberdarensis]|uniref:Uncharacterized protein n=1 Tax=Candolleomyces aberdarensis TaxID=2316362 RepID=A0A4Q2DV83_9AGAR|nr:hypothetical protein EST38_g1793 [Candolleomyces aberdarensis]
MRLPSTFFCFNLPGARSVEIRVRKSREKVATIEYQQDEKASIISEGDPVASSDPSSPKDADQKVDLAQPLMPGSAQVDGKLDVTKVSVGAFSGKYGQEVVNAIYGLADTINDLDTSFHCAYSLLLKVDSNKYRDSDGNAVEYAPTWRQYHEASLTLFPSVGTPIDRLYVQTFRRLIAESRDIASAGKYYADRYAQEVPEKLEKLRNILGDPRTEDETLDETRKRANKTIQLLEASINVLLKDMDETEKKATKLGANLKELSDRIKTLSGELGEGVICLATGVDVSITKAAEESVKIAQKKINEIEEEVATHSNFAMVGSFCIAGIGCFASAKCASSIFAALGVSAASAAFASILGFSLVKLVFPKELTGRSMLQSTNQRQNVYSIPIFPAPMRELTEAEEKLKDANAIQEEVRNIATGLGRIMEIWSSIQSDVVQLRGWLKGCLNPDVPVEDIAGRLSEDRIGLIYDILCQILQIYATQVNVRALKPLNA